MAQAWVEERNELENASNSIVEQEDSTVPDAELNQQPEVQVTGITKPITYQIIEGGTKKGADLLVDSLGYSYTKRSESAKNINWVCSSRSQHCYGRVTHIILTGAYKRGDTPHSHPGDPTSALRSSVRAIIKKEANADGASSTSEIARRTLESYQLDGEPLSYANLKKSAYRARKNKDKIPEKDFQIVVAGSKRSGDLLVDKKGYTYTRRRTSSSGTIWICSKRTTKIKCYVTVTQPPNGEKFIPSKKKHNHPGDPTILHRATLRAAVKEAATTDGESRMVDITQRVTEGVDIAKLNVSVSSIHRAASRARQKMRKSLGITGPVKRRPGGKAGQLNNDETSAAVGTINMCDTYVPMAIPPASLDFARSIALAPTTLYNPRHLPASASSSLSYITTVTPDMAADTYPTPAPMPELCLSRAEETLWEQARTSKLLSTKGSMEAEWLDGLNNEGLIANWALGIEPLPASITENRHAMEGICRARRELGFTVQRIVADAMRKKAKVDGAKGDKSMKIMAQHMSSKSQPFEPLDNYTTNVVATEAVKHSYDMAMEHAKIASYQQPLSAFEDVTTLLNCNRDNSAELPLSETSYSEGHLNVAHSVTVSEPYVTVPVTETPSTSTPEPVYHTNSPSTSTADRHQPTYHTHAPNISTANHHQPTFHTHHTHGHTSLPDHTQSHDHDYTQEVCESLSALACQTQSFQSSTSNVATSSSPYLGNTHSLH